MKQAFWSLVIGAVGYTLMLLTDLAGRERAVLAAVIGGGFVMAYEILSDRRAARAWEKVRRPS